MIYQVVELISAFAFCQITLDLVRSSLILLEGCQRNSRQILKSLSASTWTVLFNNLIMGPLTDCFHHYPISNGKPSD